MAKKRKVPPKSDPAAASAAAAAQQQEEEERQQQQQQQQQQDLQKQEEEEEQIHEEDPDLEEEDLVLDGETQVLEDDEDDQEDEEEEDPENTENVPDSTKNDKSDAVPESNPNGSNGSNGTEENEEDDGEEPVQKLLEPFTKDQLIDLLREASEKHSDVLDHIRKLSDTDPVHRKIFVHGLGWDTNSEILTDTFKKYGEIEDCNAVCDKITGKSKGYAFILFKHRSGARRALKEPQKKIGSRMTACQLASAGPVPNQPHTQAPTQSSSVSEYTQRKIYVSNVAADIDPQKLVTFFSKFGEIEEGPLGLDKQTGKPKGFALFVYKSIESAKKALEEPHKTFEGHVLHCQKAIDGPKPNKPYFNQYQQHSQGGGGGGGRPSKFARTDNSTFSGNHSAGGTGHLMAQSGPGLPYQGGGQALNPVLGQALTALLASQGGGGLGLGNLLGTLGSSGVGPTVNPTGPSMMPSGMQGGYGNQHVGSGYGGQPGMQGGYGHSQMGQGSAGRSQKGGHMGGVNPYLGH